jgi:DHA3 family macrolide efflux protein-like MFS transporter
MISPSKWKRNVALFMVGQGITLFGSSLVYFAVMWHITLETQSGLMMTFIMIAGMLPTFLISPIAGVWADRFSKKNLIIISDAFTALVTLIMAAMFTLGYEFMSLLLICLAARAGARGVQMPAFNAMIPELVPDDSLTRINGINASIQTFMTFASPALGGVLLAIAPIHLLLYIDVLTTAIGISILLFFVKLFIPSGEAEQKPGAKKYFSEIGEGFKYIGRNPLLKKGLIISALLNFMIASTAMTPLQVTRNWGEGLWSLFGAFSIGAEHRLAITEMGYSGGLVLGGIVIGIWSGFKNKNYTFALSTALVGIATIGLGIVTNFWLYSICMLLVGFFLSTRGAPIMSMLQLNISREYMGRSMSVLMMTATLFVQLGMMLWGPLGDIMEIEWLLLFSGGFIFLMGIVIFFDKTLRKAGIVVSRVDDNCVSDKDT